jgi:hypothetical protein
MATILVLYHYFVHSLGPRFMVNKRPFELKGLLIAHNLSQVLANVYLFWRVIQELLLLSSHKSCLLVVFSRLVQQLQPQMSTNQHIKHKRRIRSTMVVVEVHR